jgi:hypothetical protein
MKKDYIKKTCLLFLLPALLFLVISGCSKSTPNCDDSKTVDAVIDAVGQNMKKKLAGIAGVQPGMELSDDEWKLMRAGMIISLENIKGMKTEEGKSECSADLIIVSGGSKETTPITYNASIQKDSGSLQITLFGFD